MDADDHHSLLHAKLGPTFGMKLTIGGDCSTVSKHGRPGFETATREPMKTPGIRTQIISRNQPVSPRSVHLERLRELEKLVTEIQDIHYQG